MSSYRPLVSASDHDGVAVRTGQGLVGQGVYRGLVADAADSTAYLALLLT